MNIGLLILIIITAIWISVIIASAIKGYEITFFASLLTLIFINGIFGWGIIATETSATEEIVTFKKERNQITKTKYLILVENSGIIFEFDELVDISNINDTTTFFMEKNYNFYNVELKKYNEIFYKIGDVIYYGKIRKQ